MIGSLFPPSVHTTCHLYPAQSFDRVTINDPMSSNDCNKLLNAESVVFGEIPVKKDLGLVRFFCFCFFFHPYHKYFLNPIVN